MACYKDGLKDIEGLMLNPENFGTIIGAWMPTVVFDTETKITREKILKKFSANGIDAECSFGHCLVCRCLIND